MHRDHPPLWPAVVGVVLLSALLLGAVALVAVWKDVPAASLTQDPVSTAGLRWHTGFLHSISILVWGAVTATCLLGAATWRRSGDTRTFSTFLLASAALTLALALDYVFQLRGELYPDHLGLSEVTVFAVYTVALGIFAMLFGATVLRTEYVVLATALAFFVTWLAMRYVGLERVAQDGVKLVGQLLLFLYFFRTSAYGVTRTSSGMPGQDA
jgi:hypothetical protein